MATEASTAADPVALGNQYKQEFETTIEGLRLRSTAIQQQLQEQLAAGPAAIEPLKADFIQSVQDQADVTTPAGKVLSTFAWTTVLVLGSSVGFFVGANILGGAVHLLIGGFAIALLSLGALPAYAYTQIKAKQEANATDADIRMYLLAYAAGSGLLLGAGFSQSYFESSEPLALLAPLAVSLVFAYGAPALGAARTNLLGASVGGGVLLSLAIGLLTGSLSATYFLVATLYAGVTFLTLQYLFKNVTSESASTHLYMLAYVVGYLYVKALTYGLLSSSTPSGHAAEAAPPAPARK